MNRTLRDSDLQQLLSPEFEASVVASTPRTLCVRLGRTDAIRALRRRYIEGTLADRSLREFVNEVLIRFAGHDAFPHQLALAAIAVVLEPYFTEFANEYLRDLARVRSARLAIASRVARLALDRRLRETATSRRLLLVEELIPERVTFDVAVGPGNRSLAVNGVKSQLQVA